MSRHDQPDRPRRYQPSWDTLREDEFDFTGVVRQTHLMAHSLRAVMEAYQQTGEVTLRGARIMARHLADHLAEHLDPTPTALHHFAITGAGVSLDLIQEVILLIDIPSCPLDIRRCADGLATFVHQELDRLGLWNGSGDGPDGGPA